MKLNHRGFNPCFDGSEARDALNAAARSFPAVSILVLMEVKRETAWHREYRHAVCVSILVLMEVKREPN